MANNVPVHVKYHLVVFRTIHEVIPILESNNFFVYLYDNFGDKHVNGAKPPATTAFKKHVTI